MKSWNSNPDFFEADDDKSNLMIMIPNGKYHIMHVRLGQQQQKNRR